MIGGYAIQSVDVLYISVAAADKYKREFASDEMAVLRIAQINMIEK